MTSHDRVHRPCANCPWRKDAPVNYWHPDHFRSIATTCRNDGLHMMQCHKTTKETLRICAGWAAVEGFDAIGLRIAALFGRYDPASLDTKGLELYESFDEMLEANNIDLER